MDNNNSVDSAVSEESTEYQSSYPGEDEYPSRSAPTSFILFPLLPLEIRLVVWGYTRVALRYVVPRFYVKSDYMAKFLAPAKELTPRNHLLPRIPWWWQDITDVVVKKVPTSLFVNKESRDIMTKWYKNIYTEDGTRNHPWQDKYHHMWIDPSVDCLFLRLDEWRKQKNGFNMDFDNAATNTLCIKQLQRIELIVSELCITRNTVCYFLMALLVTDFELFPNLKVLVFSFEIPDTNWPRLVEFWINDYLQLGVDLLDMPHWPFTDAWRVKLQQKVDVYLGLEEIESLDDLVNGRIGRCMHPPNPLNW
ncbi:hypothetical protein BJ875DRAFT_232693 [Amylocarpus encephaloides]|uniref:2EXR domain-containing protein n=1 Tax=Amylocarpus encephaloides TaxID=45428 RepID=A0A9P7YNP6_9HELO|nr:hypothetical protein BJ875DRAFT_232693 [Amylocarpus encephaloides]